MSKSSSRPFVLRAARLGAALLLGTALSQLSVTAAHAQSLGAAQAPRNFAIAAQPLIDAMREFSHATGIQVVYAASVGASVSSPGVSGALSSGEALSRLLAGTGLSFRFTGPNAITLEPAPQSGGAVTLGPVRVEGGGSATPLAGSSDVAATEDTGSYAAHAVTLGKSAQSLREIPQSVSVLTRQQMDDQALTTTAEALDQVTGVRTFGYERTESVMIRGYTANAQYDGVPQQGADSNSSIGDLALFDRIEVLRGPSGLLTGTGEPGGTVNYVRKRPKKDFDLSGLASVGSWDRYRGELDLTGPFNASGSLRGRVVGIYQDEDKFYDVGYNKDRTLYGIVEYDLTPRTTIAVGGLYAHRDYINFFGLPLYSDGTVPSRKSYTGSDANSRTATSELFFDITHDFGGGWQAKGAYNYRDIDYDGASTSAWYAIDKATGLVSGLSAGRIEQDITWHSFDIHVNGPVKLFGQEHQLTLGVNRSRYDFVGGTNFAFPTDWDMLNDHDFSAVIPSNVVSKYETLTVQTGIYGSARLRLADPLTVIVGGRLSYYKNKERDVLPDRTAWVESNATTNGRFTPYVGAVLDVTPQVSLYASYVDTFVPQTAQDVNNRVLDPRVGWQAEAGVKAALFDDALNATLAVFRLRDTNRPIIDEFNIGCGGTADGTCTRAAGKIQSQGIEAEVTGSPLPGWDITAGYTYNRQKYLSDSDPDNVGQRFQPERMPVHLFKLWSQFSFGKAGFEGPLSGLKLGAGVQSQSNMYSSVIRQGGYAIASARVAYDLNEKWEAGINVGNIFDKTYLRIPGYASFYNIYGEPRSFRLTLRGRI
ncbi:TonB-dependent siderophore receptor [Novosphingobium sp. ZW T3_23]|uniref:TonB-dependent siderophore receptor n=1 Tax=Novosphingobium sp. ZW T3_23 TaxID=3378084 RepID=UPI003853C94A